MTAHTAIGLGLAAASTTLTNLAYQREHDAAAALPVLSMRRPLHSLHLLFTSRGWLLGFVMESIGFLLYAAALALASLAVVQSIAAGGIGVLAYVGERVSGRPLDARRRTGVALSVVGLAALGITLAKTSGSGGNGSLIAILVWLGGTAGLAFFVIAIARRAAWKAVAEGVAGGLFFSIGDISTKLATQGGARTAFVIPLIAGYTLGTSFLQLGYQRGGALTVAGLATLITNALPIAAGTILLHEPIPPGFWGILRVVAFAAVTAGAILLARPDPKSSGQQAADGRQG